MLLVFAALFLPGYFTPPGATFGRGLPLFLTISFFQTLLLLYLMALRGQTGLTASGVRAPKLSDLVSALAAASALLALSAGLGWILSRLGGWARQALEPRIPPVAALTPPALALLSLATGYREELFYRCYLVTRLISLGLPAAAGVAVAALVFALGHLTQGPAAVLLALVQGTAFGLLLRHGWSLHALALAHALYNFAVFLTYRFA